jgi:hypothetical protein
MITDGSLAENLRVPDVYLSSANSLFLYFLPFNRISKLREISGAQNSDSPRLHHFNNFNLKLDTCVLGARGRSRRVPQWQSRDDELLCAAQNAFSYN